MSQNTFYRVSFKGRMRTLASVTALVVGTLGLAGCGDDDEMPPVEEQEPPTQQQQDSPMENPTEDPGLDQDGSAGAQPPMEEEPERGEAPISEDEPMYEDLNEEEEEDQ